MSEKTNEEMSAQYEARANAEREAGGSIKIERGLPWIAIVLSDGAEYYFQEWQADDLLATVPEWAHAEDYLLAQAQDW